MTVHRIYKNNFNITWDIDTNKLMYTNKHSKKILCRMYNNYHTFAFYKSSLSLSLSLFFYK